jgi:hypothetical protein
MRYIVTYSRVPIRLADGRATTDGFSVRDTSASPTATASHHVTRAAAIDAAATLNAGADGAEHPRS